MRKGPPVPRSAAPARSKPVPGYLTPSKARERSLAQENSLAKTLGGRRVPGSGAFVNRPGDVKSDLYLVECKTTRKNSYSLSASLLSKIEDEAFASQRAPLFAITFEEKMAGEKDWVVISASELRSLLEMAKLV